MHLCLASSPHRAGGVTAGRIFLQLALACCCISGACARDGAQADPVTVEWQLTPKAPPVDQDVLVDLMLRDKAGRALPGAKVTVEAHMTHPAMAPVIAAAAERGAGSYRAILRFTMRGGWILRVTGNLPNGRRINHQIDVRVEPSPR